MRILVALALLLGSTSALADVYLLSRTKLDGTDYTQAVFLSHPQMTTLAACEAERKAARTTGFKLFARVYFVTRKGLSVQDQFYCVDTTQKIATFQGRGFAEHTYLINLKGNAMSLEPHPSFGACMARAGEGNQSSPNRFCAKSTQALQ